MNSTTAAERHYKNHLQCVSSYQKRNAEKMRVKQKNYLQNMKINNPEKYHEYLAKKRKYYKNVVKPKNNKIDAHEQQT